MEYESSPSSRSSSLSSSSDFPPREDSEEEWEYSDEENAIYVEFIKRYAPVLLHLAQGNEELTKLIKELERLEADATPDAEKVTTIRSWVSAVQDQFDSFSQEQIREIIEESEKKKLRDDSCYKNEYALPDKRYRGYKCSISLDPIRYEEYYVGVLDNKTPYQLRAVVDFYTNQKLDKNRKILITPLRRELDDKDIEYLEDLIKWYTSSYDGNEPRRSVRLKGKETIVYHPSHYFSAEKRRTRRKKPQDIPQDGPEAKSTTESPPSSKRKRMTRSKSSSVSVRGGKRKRRTFRRNRTRKMKK